MKSLLCIFVPLLLLLAIAQAHALDCSLIANQEVFFPPSLQAPINALQIVEDDLL